MAIHYDDKGKFFTNIVSKDPILATIQTLSHKVRGNVYVRQGDRLIDELHASGPFIAVTDATVYDANDNVLLRSSFLTINREHIIWLVPDEEARTFETNDGGQA